MIDNPITTMDLLDKLTEALPFPARLTPELQASLKGQNISTYADTTWSQWLADCISAYVNALALFDGVPRHIVCDNLRSGITRPGFHEPRANRSYADMARHYGIVVIPARPYKARNNGRGRTVTCA